MAVLPNPKSLGSGRLRSHRFFKIALTYQIQYLPITRNHFRFLTARQVSTIFDAVRKQLTDAPDVVTRNKFPMRSNDLATWELRIGNLRVYYDIETSPEPVVYILAVGVKEGNQVRIGGELRGL